MKVTIDTDSGEQDITDLIVVGDFNVGVTSTIGDFDLKFLDPDKTYYNLIKAFDDVYIYADYGTEATTKRFRYKIEDKGYVDFNTTISGRGIGMIMAEKSIIYKTEDGDGNLTSKAKSTILQEIIEANFSDITDFSEIETDSTTVEKNYSEIPFFDIVEDLCGTTKYFYLDKDLVPHYFTKGTQKNTTEAVIDNNLVAVSNNSDNSEEIYTRVRIYGKSEDDIPIIYTKNIGTTNTKGINKDYIVNNASVTSTAQAEYLGDAIANDLTSSTRIGDIISLILPNLLPGESLFMSLPEYDIEPGYYNIKEFSIKIDNEGDYPLTTAFTIEKKRLNSAIVVKDIIQTQVESTENSNPNDLDYSRIITFEEDSGTHSNTEINENYLKVKQGQSTGQWISDLFELTSQITSLQIKWSGDYLVADYAATSSNIWFSLDGGTTWRYYHSGTFTIPAGSDLKIRVDLNQSTAKVKRIGVYYNL